MRRRLVALVCLALPLAACADPQDSADAAPTIDAAPPVDADPPDAVNLPIPSTCNGDEALCPRRYDQVAYATTHNAMSNSDEGWYNANQHHGLTRQLEDGVRALMLDVHAYDGSVYLCHAVCQLGKTELVVGLREIRAFLDFHRGEVVTLILENYVAAAELETAFAQSGLARYVRVQGLGTPWPTLRELIDADQRLVVLTDSEGGQRPWLMDVWAFAWETRFSYATPADLSCAPNRGDPASSLFIFNHFLTGDIGGAPELAEQVNHDPLLADRVAECQGASGRLPNFVTVDYYDIGDVFGVVDALNAAP